MLSLEVRIVGIEEAGRNSHATLGTSCERPVKLDIQDLNVGGIFDAYYFGARQSCNRRWAVVVHRLW